MINYDDLTQEELNYVAECVARGLTNYPPEDYDLELNLRDTFKLRHDEHLGYIYPDNELDEDSNAVVDIDIQEHELGISC